MCKALLNKFGIPFATSAVDDRNQNDVYNTNENDVLRKYNSHRERDPYPSIPPALLNSVDIHNYILATGMVSPYYPDKLKPVTYGIKLSNADYLYWEDGKPVTGNFRYRTDVNNRNEKIFILKSNSILYVSIEPYLRLPLYIAARFNLKIDYIHKGILLGTGPVVDPGFEGKLCVPLHNLTNNDYELKIDSTFIWMEFTKVSPNVKWSNGEECNKHDITPKGYDNEAKGRGQRTISDYVSKAYPGAISSSMIVHKKETDKILERANKALKKAEGLNKTFLWGVVASIAGIAISVLLFAFRIITWDISNDKENKAHFQQQIDSLNTKINSLDTLIIKISKEN